MSFTLLLAALAQITSSSPALPPDGQRPQWVRQQTFVAPSGEPFHAPIEARYPAADWFAGADANHDGELTLAEFTVDFVRFFNVLDTNHDGVIDSTELEHYENVVAPEVHSRPWGGGSGGGGAGDSGGGGHHHGGGGGGGHGGWGGGGGHRGGGEGEGGGEGGGERSSHSSGGHDDYASHPQGAARFDLLGMPEPVAAMDVNLNGRITRDEAVEAATQRFEVLETMHRGYLTLDQLPQTFAQQHKPRQHGGWQGQDIPHANPDR